MLRLLAFCVTLQIRVSEVNFIKSRVNGRYHVKQKYANNFIYLCFQGIVAQLLISNDPSITLRNPSVLAQLLLQSMPSDPSIISSKPSYSYANIHNGYNRNVMPQIPLKASIENQNLIHSNGFTLFSQIPSTQLPINVFVSKAQESPSSLRTNQQPVSVYPEVSSIDTKTHQPSRLHNTPLSNLEKAKTAPVLTTPIPRQLWISSGNPESRSYKSAVSSEQKHSSVPLNSIPTSHPRYIATSSRVTKGSKSLGFKMLLPLLFDLLKEKSLCKMKCKCCYEHKSETTYNEDLKNDKKIDLNKSKLAAKTAENSNDLN